LYKKNITKIKIVINFSRNLLLIMHIDRFVSMYLLFKLFIFIFIYIIFILYLLC